MSSPSHPFHSNLAVYYDNDSTEDEDESVQSSTKAALPVDELGVENEKHDEAVYAQLVGQDSQGDPDFDTYLPTQSQNSITTLPVTNTKNIIVAIIRDINKQLDNSSRLFLDLEDYSTGCISSQSSLSSSPSSSVPKLPALHFPGKNNEETRRFVIVLTILRLALEAIEKGIVITKRDMYYRDPRLFESQPTVDRHIDLITSTLGIKRTALNIRAAAKGLIHGNAVLTKSNGSKLDLRQALRPTLIQDISEYICADVSKVEWILVVEKEASFQSILSSRFYEEVGSRGLLMTAKGYPDLISQQMLKALSTPTPWNRFRHPRVSILTDYDPDGIGIANMFQYGSLKSSESINAAIPTARRLGLDREHIKETSNNGNVQKVLPLTARDRRRAIGILNRNKDQTGNTRLNDRLDLQVMLMLNIKAEIQILDDSPNDLESLLESL